MSQRFFIERPVDGNRTTLEGDEAHHLMRVMRAGIGDEVLLFDGTGAEFLARVAAIHKSHVEMAITERRAIDRELPFMLTLAVALPKGERQKWLVEKATELGATRLVPLISQRGVAQPVESTVARLRRAVTEASKQCGRNRLMEIGEPVALESFLGSEPRSEVRGQRSDALAPVSCLRLIADPSGRPLRSIARSESDVIAAIGPEGGFTPAELAAAVENGWQPVSLGKSILRVETAAVAIAAWAALR